MVELSQSVHYENVHACIHASAGIYLLILLDKSSTTQYTNVILQYIITKPSSKQQWITTSIDNWKWGVAF
jgi:hypothetical protein